MKLLKKINLINSHEIIVLFPHASSYAEQLLVNKSHKSIYGVVYPSCKINFKEEIRWHRFFFNNKIKCDLKRNVVNGGQCTELLDQVAGGEDG